MRALQAATGAAPAPRLEAPRHGGLRPIWSDALHHPRPSSRILARQASAFQKLMMWW